MDISKYISKFTRDPRTRRVLQNISRIDDSPDARCVLRNFLSGELTELINTKTPNLFQAARSFVCAPEPKNIYRGFQLYIWLKEQIPAEHDRESLILLGMMEYIEGEKRAESARDIVDTLVIR